MHSRLIASALCGVTLLIVTASAQQPREVGDNRSQSLPGDSKNNKSDPSDGLIQAALIHDVDVKMAQAKVQLAEAELAKAKQAVVLKVLTLNMTIQDLKSQVAIFSQSLAMIEKSVKEGTSATALLDEPRMKRMSAQNALAKAEMELKLLTGGMQKEGTKVTGALEVEFFVEPRVTALKVLTESVDLRKELQVIKGPISDRVRAALDKPVKLGPKGEEITFEKALEIFKRDAGLDVPVRKTYAVRPIISEGEELPVGAWFQLFADHDRECTNPPGPGPHFVLREYGLLVTRKELVPPDAMPLLEFWKRSEQDSGSQGTPTLRKYPVPPGSAEATAKTLSLHQPALQILPLPATDEILVLATQAEHIIILKQLNDIGVNKKPEPKTQIPDKE
jgi:hypothetical protein